MILACIVLLVIPLCRENFDDSDPKIHEMLDKLIKVDPAAKNIRMSRGNKSYTINKKTVYLCLYDENGNYYDDNLLMYVSLHELAHVKNDEKGHTKKFYRIFDELQDKAAAMGYFDKNAPLDQNYCEFKTAAKSE